MIMIIQSENVAVSLTDNATPIGWVGVEFVHDRFYPKDRSYPSLRIEFFLLPSLGENLRVHIYILKIESKI